MDDTGTVRRIRDRLREARIQRDELDREIADLEATIKTISRFESGPAGGATPARRRRGPRTLGDYIVEALLTADSDGMTSKEIAEQIERMGYKYKGKTDPVVTITSEISRLVRLGKRGLTRLGSGVYCVRK
jgi:hypothetical protein